MTKKINLRQPSGVADDWVTGRTVATQEKLARLTIDMPPDLHSRFKAACAKNRLKMKNEVLLLIEAWIQKHENL